MAYVTTTFPTSATFLENEIRRLLELGVRVRVFTLRPPPRHPPREHRDLLAVTRHVGTPFDPRIGLAILRWWAKRGATLSGGLASALRASIGSPYALAGHAAFLPSAARLADWIEHEDLAHVHGAWAHFPASVAFLAARLTGRTFSLAAHAGSDLYRTQAWLPEKLRAARFAHACTQTNAETLRRLGGPGVRVVAAYHGVDLDRFDGGARSPDERAPRLLAVGRFARTKGFDVAIRALGILARRGLRPRLTLIGSGPEEPRYAELARAVGVEAQVERLPTQPQVDLLAHYRRASLLLAPSRQLGNGRVDGIPNVIVEAMAMGVPCVATRVGGIPEAVLDGRTGRLCEPDDPEGLANATGELLRDPVERRRMGDAARDEARRRFDARRNFERLFDALGPCLERDAAEPWCREQDSNLHGVSPSGF